MKVLKYVLIVIGVVIVFILIAALFIPKHYEVVRSVVIQAPQELVMDNVKSLKKMNEWSPFIEGDPNIILNYGGTEGQVGAFSSWKSKKSGEGTQTITSLTKDRMETRLDFRKPMESTCNAYFETAKENGVVKATWGMEGRNPYPFNIMCLFMDNMIGTQYEKGLANLKQRCEQQAKRSMASQ